MIGSWGRNAGKTVLATRLIREGRERGSQVVALKVTTIADGATECHKGGLGCGACTSFTTGFVLDEETDASGATDTSKLLAAGAKKVFWLRSRASSLADGYRAFEAKLAEAGLSGCRVVCESNSLRKAVKPGEFIMLKTNGKPKPSAAEVEGLADVYKDATNDTNVHE
jgi:hypothetical protein